MGQQEESIAKELMKSHNRPRRIEADMVAYIKAVQAGVDANADDEEGDEESSDLLYWNVIEELSNRAASAASERHSCEPMEKILDKCTESQLLVLCTQFEGYWMHLWTNRYSSHVLQKIFIRLGKMVHAEEEGTVYVEEGRIIPTTMTVLGNMMNELQVSFPELVQDVSASHVFRSFLCVLAGKQPLVQKRGKKGKHRALATELRREEEMSSFVVPAQCTMWLEKIIKQLLLDCEQSQLHALIHDTHAGPVLSVLFRLLPVELVDSALEKVLNWESNPERAQDLFYEFSGHPVASHMMESLFEVGSPTWTKEVFERCLATNLMDYCKDPVANYVVQYAIASTASAELLTIIFTELVQLVDVLLELGRKGVIWKLMEACCRLNIGQKEVSEALLEGVVRRHKREDLVVVAQLLQIQIPDEKTTKLWMDVSGARIVENWLKFDPKYSKLVLNSLLSMDAEILSYMAKDTTASRYLIEPLWEDTKAAKRLLTALEPHFRTLAVDRVGVFSVLKAFNQMELAAKIRIVQALVPAETQLSGSHFGRMAIKETRLFEFKTQRDVWMKASDKGKKVKDLFQEMLTDTENVKEIKQENETPKDQLSEELSEKTRPKKKQKKSKV